jgi:hypothetical protein
MQLWYGAFYRHQYKQSSRQKSVIDTITVLYVPYHNFIYNRLPEDELSGSKHTEDIKKLDIKILI